MELLGRKKNTIFQVNAQFFKPSGRYLLDPYRGRFPLSTAAVVAKLQKTAARQHNKYIDDISLSNDKASSSPYYTAVYTQNNRVTAATNFTTVTFDLFRNREIRKKKLNPVYIYCIFYTV